MCHIIKAPLLEGVRVQGHWILGWKEIITSETGALQAPVMGTTYRPIQLEHGFVLHDKTFDQHSVDIHITTQSGDTMTFDVACKPGLYAHYSPSKAPRGWAVAARLEWVGLASDTGFSSHTLLCTKPAKRLPKLIEEYTRNAGQIWRFSLHFTGRKDEVLSPVYGCHSTAEGAVAEAIKRLQSLRPLSEIELAILRNELEGYPSHRGYGVDIYAEIRSPMWMR